MPKPKAKYWYLQPLKVGSSTVEVRYSKDLDSFGTYCSYPHPTICLGDQSESIVASTLFHESLHSISDLFELGLTEHQVRVLEQVVVSLLKDNPTLTKNLLK